MTWKVLSGMFLAKSFYLLGLLLCFANKELNIFKVILTDDDTGEISSLKTAWPQATFLLCQWHALQARYICMYAIIVIIAKIAIIAKTWYYCKSLFHLAKL